MELLSTSEEETLNCAAQFAANLKLRDTVALIGPLGAGKTLFCRGIIHHLGYSGAITSPTYSLAQEYPARISVVHMDLYRLAPHSDWEEIGLNHYLESEAICLIEWPERLPTGLHSFTYRVELQSVGESVRHIRIEKIEPNN